MQYRVQFLDGSNEVVREAQADARTAANAFLLVANERSGCARSIGLGALFQFQDPSPMTRHPHSSRGLAAQFGIDPA